jgi:hypothetical protein
VPTGEHTAIGGQTSGGLTVGESDDADGDQHARGQASGGLTTGGMQWINIEG